ncbi:hypothetical protein ACTJJ0_13060 [Chitinophaga sp. 22321]|uniref:Immunity protein 50 n=1 Tax=Chitinophaga hostae TaxID=2831022 RepID=A0ABS5J186_9BACT|nr:hypothetical protein [Chitinophaga hostae]MBS0028870.1 hypothetical protein [Chitinophaga hostae]
MEKIVLSISNNLRIYLPSTEVFLNFEEVDIDEFSGFYDWLRNNKGDILGVRIWMTQSNVIIGPMLLGKPYVFIEKDASWSIFFDKRYSFVDVNANLSADQEFFSIDFYENKHGEELLIVIDCSSLSDAEQQTIKQLLA